MPIDTDTRSNSFTSLLPSVNPTTWRRHRKPPWVDPWSLGMWGESLHHLSVDVPEKMAHDMYGLLWIMSFINSKCHYHTYYYDISTISLYKSWTIKIKMRWTIHYKPCIQFNINDTINCHSMAMDIAPSKPWFTIGPSLVGGFNRSEKY